MIGARGIGEQGFGDGIPAAGLAFHHQLADFLSAWRAARLAGDQRLDGSGFQCRRKTVSLGGLASPLAAFERDEPSCLFFKRCWTEFKVLPNRPSSFTASAA